MKSFGNSTDYNEITVRVRNLRADSRRRWGRMTAPQMVRHLTDSFLSIIGERPTTTPTRTAPFWGRTALRWIALYAPLKWPKGIRTRPDVDQERGGTPPSGDFAADVAALEDACARFLETCQRRPLKPHFMFGTLSAAQWTRWAYLHVDHHLRQFGC
jgi:hypothetical protein